jgi:hypothetical protein
MLCVRASTSSSGISATPSRSRTKPTGFYCGDLVAGYEANSGLIVVLRGENQRIDILLELVLCLPQQSLSISIKSNAREFQCLLSGGDLLEKLWV